MTLDAYSTALDPIPGKEAWFGEEAFWLPTRFVPLSGWNEHGPFMSWLVATLRPRSYAELGTHYGFSYFVVCDAVKRLGLDTRTWAIDSWEGDEHAGFYGDEVYDSVRIVNDAEYAGFSTLLRGYFDDHVGGFDDGSIDLLHIDGRHRYEDVKHDYESWLPKVSDRGVVLFHDIAERQGDFGVWRFWEELSTRYPSFAFQHGHGLGVLGVGSRLPEAATRFFAAAAEREEEVRGTYAHLGRRLQDIVDQKDISAALTGQLGEARAQLEEARAALGTAQTEAEAARAELARTRATLSWKVTTPLRALRRGGRG